MAMTVSGAGVKSDVAGVLLDIVQEFDGFIADSGLASRPLASYRGNAFQYGSNVGFQLLASLVGALPTYVFDAAIGRAFYRCTSQAAAYRGATSSTANGSNGVRFPSHQLFTGAGAIPIPFLRPLRRYTFRAPTRIVSLTGGSAFLGTTDGGAGDGANWPAWAQGWIANATINGGRWTAGYRRTALGAVTIAGNSGVLGSPTNWTDLGLRYTEGPVPSLEWLLDGVPRFRVEGDNVWQPQITTPSNGPVPTIQTLPVVGTVFEVAAARFIVEEIGA